MADLSEKDRETGGGGRVGLIVPPANPVAESEIGDLLPRSVRMHVARFAPHPSEDLIERVRSYDKDLGRAAAQFGGMDLDAVALAFAATSFLRGRERDQEILDELRSGRDIPTTNAADAVVRRAQELGEDRVTLVSPYPDELDELAVDYWSAAGLEIVDLLHVVPPGGSIYRTRSEQVFDVVSRQHLSGKGMIVLCGTGMATADQLWRIQRVKQQPCISYNSAIASWLLARVGPFATPRTRPSA